MIRSWLKLAGKVENVLAIALAPITLAIALSWNAQANDTFYPLRQALEKLISLSPLF